MINIEGIISIYKNATPYEIDPHMLISPLRLDLIIRYVAGIDIIIGKHDGMGLSVYQKWLEASHGTNEISQDDDLTKCFCDYESKIGFQEYVNAYSELLCSMQINGYIKEKHIPLDCKSMPINGMHRCAAALLTGNSVYAVDYPCVDIPWRWRCGRLKSTGFTDIEIAYLVYEYMLLSGGHAYVSPTDSVSVENLCMRADYIGSFVSMPECMKIIAFDCETLQGMVEVPLSRIKTSLMQAKEKINFSEDL